MKYIRLDKRYKEQLRKIYKIVFEDSFDEEYCEFCLNHDNFWEQTYGWVDDDKLITTYTTLDIELQIRKKVFKCHHLDGVATLPTHRNQGLVKKMLLEDVKECRKNNIPIISLDPFKHSYYRNQGFEVAMESNKIEMDFALLSKEAKDSSYYVKMDYLNENEDLQKDYKELCDWFWDNSPYNEMKQPLSYEETKFKHTDIFIAIAYDRNNQPHGYMIYTESEKTLNITSFRYINLKAFYALKNQLLSYRDQINKIRFSKTPNDFPINLLVKDYWTVDREVKITKTLSRMLRIVDVKVILEGLMCSLPKSRVCLKIEDRLIEDNNGRFIIDIDGQVNKIKDNDCPDEEIEVSISDIVPLISGRKSAVELYFEGRLRMSGSTEVYHSTNYLPEVIKVFDKLYPKTIAFNAEEMLSI